MGNCSAAFSEEKFFDMNDIKRKKKYGWEGYQDGEANLTGEQKEKRVNELVGHKLTEYKTFRVSTLPPQATMTEWFQVKSQATTFGKHTWERRYVEMFYDRIAVYKKEHHLPDEKPESEVSLRNVTNISLALKDDRYRIDMLRKDGKKFSMLTAVKELRDKWMRAFERNFSWMREVSAFPLGEMDLRINEEGVALVEPDSANTNVRYINIMDISGWGNMDTDPRLFSIKMLPEVKFDKRSNEQYDGRGKIGATPLKNVPVWWRLWTFAEANSTELGDYLLGYAYKKTYALRENREVASAQAKDAEREANGEVSSEINGKKAPTANGGTSAATNGVLPQASVVAPKRRKSKSKQSKSKSNASRSNASRSKSKSKSKLKSKLKSKSKKDEEESSGNDSDDSSSSNSSSNSSSDSDSSSDSGSDSESEEGKDKQVKMVV